MTSEPIISFQTIDAAIDTSFYQKVVLVGNSTAAAGIYKDIELLSEEDIKSKFGAGTHLASMIEEARYQMRNSLTKPKIIARSYQDGGSHTANIKAITLSGTATKDSILKVSLNKNAPSIVATIDAILLAARLTKDANIGQFSKDISELGSPNKASNNTQAIVSLKKLELEISITKGDTAATIAAAINSSINAMSQSPFTSTVSGAVVTATTKNKGIIANESMIEFSSVDGISFATSETAATGTVDISSILDSTDNEGTKLGEMDFDSIVIPYGYSNTALVNDAYAKTENVSNYNNQCLDYRIFQATAIDTNVDNDIDTLSSNNPISSKGGVRILLVLHKSGGMIKGLTSTTQAAKLKTKQLNPIYSLGSKLEFGSQFTLAETVGFKKLQSVINAMMIRFCYVNKFILQDFWNKNYVGEGEPIDASEYSKITLIDKFLLYYDILSNRIEASNFTEYLNISIFQGIVVNSQSVRENYEKIIRSTMTFNTTTGQLSMSLLTEIAKPILALSLINQVQ